jgi:hypothetical protein
VRYFLCVSFSMMLWLGFAIKATAKTQQSPQKSVHGLMVKGKPMNPACLNLTSTWLSDQGIITRSIVPANCQNSNQAFEGQTVFHHQSSLCYKHQHEQFCYQVIGQTKNGLYVVSTFSASDQGSGIFSDWRLYRYKKTTDYNAVLNHPTQGKTRPQQRVLTLLAVVPTGDQSSPNAINHLRLSGDLLTGDLRSKNKTKDWDLSIVR